jgi:hypothetical protein
MSRRNKRESPTPIGLLPMAERLRAERPEATAHELDRAKLRALSQATRADSDRGPRLGHRAGMRSRRVISIALVIGLMSSGTAVIAKSGGPTSAASTTSASQDQYCPPSSPGGTKTKKPGPSKCGKP